MKVTYKLHIDVDYPGEGSWDDGASVGQVLKQVQDEAVGWQVLLKRGATEPFLVRSRITVASVTLLPEPEEIPQRVTRRPPALS